MEKVAGNIAIVLLGLLAWLSAGTVQGQQGAGRFQAQIRATATVVDNIDLLTIRDLYISQPPLGDSVVLISPIRSEQAALMLATGLPDAQIRITYILDERLEEREERIGEIGITYLLSFAEEDTQPQSLQLDVGEAILRLSPKGELYFWLGASMDLRRAVPGVYESEFIMEIEYI
ncbi:hypothetical protein A3SI_02923 [Nitritalea halalkaliphila LW7]|uniref:DUF4402 domain-containing protein n=1 Tax=Nitritalea halalkaliphila LW7 TaxID=1189621 RepID=I5C9H3_9BACT|nr:hypothetical protein [Nitritalea halalkaliphila]EIM78475.1 hypothetical protein A3SI_02923 [Nitritalea halalkaliphila LW7]